MQLTQDKVDEIYDLYTWDLSQRYIAKNYWHGRGTISRHLKPIAIIEHFHSKEYEAMYKKHELEEKVSDYRNLAILSLVLFAMQVSINFFY
jgi:IS30 family transposase